MVTIADITGVIQSLTVVKDLMQANRSMGNFNETVAALYEVNAKLLALQSAALEFQEEEAALSQRIRELEKENMELKNWDRERERYQLTKTTAGGFVYSVKPGMENNEPAHLLCAKCFEDNKKSILQPLAPEAQSRTYTCPRCGKMVHVHSVSASDFPRAKRIRHWDEP